jgi:hypothetical protein
VSIQAANVTIAAGGIISADGQGYMAQAGPGAGGNNNGGGGGGYGGNGGSAFGGFGPFNNGGGTYGSLLLPVDLGSGGGGDPNGFGGSGGGAVELDVSQTLSLNGLITCDGLPGQAGAGSGGSILILADNLTGSGTLQANGGVSTQGNGGDGGGGRIAALLSKALNLPTNSFAANAGGPSAQNGTVEIIIETPDLKIQPQNSGGSMLTWGAFPIYSYQVQYSTNLPDWSDLNAAIAPTNYTFLAVSNFIGHDPQGFYRVKVFP